MKLSVRQLIKTPAFTLGLVVVAGALLLGSVGIQSRVQAQDAAPGKLITVYDRGLKNTFLTTEKTLDKALDEADIQLDPRDTVEPSLKEELVASEYKVNIYRARPVVVVDGISRTKTMTPFQTPERITKDVGVTLYPEDKATMSRSSDLLGDGAGLQLTIDRALLFTLDLYGRTDEARSRASTVGAMLKEKGITLTENDRVSLSLSTPITAGMQVRVWREGKQTIAVDQPTAFTKEIIYDADRPVGYRAIQTAGVPGVRTITYEIEIKDGAEIARTEIARIITKEPSRQIDVIGIKGLEQGLTKSKGAIHHTDSNGVTHRETYYDLNMRVVMQSCGQGGAYSVRFDGMKIDRDGYIIIAANYARYPKCSVVETSAGPGKVYDTGGFVLRHPDGFDLATDWTRADGI